MKVNTAIPVLAATLLIAACSSEQAPPAAGEAPTARGEVGVENLPDPCVLLDLAGATALLDMDALEQQNLENRQAKSRICHYQATDGSGRVILMSLTLLPASAMSSSVDSLEQLVEKATQLAGGLAPSEVLDDVGNVSFVFNQDSATRVQVLTGIGAIDTVSGAPSSELLLGYAINYAELAPPARRDILTALAREHLVALQPVI